MPLITYIDMLAFTHDIIGNNVLLSDTMTTKYQVVIDFGEVTKSGDIDYQQMK